MSGGIAYVLDVTGNFPGRCNTAMVVLEKLEDPQEIAEVRGMIERHVRYTGSDRGRYLLQLWEDMVPKFVKVMPKDYMRVLSALKKANESGLSGDDAITAAFEENSRDVARIGGG
jgi:glutamate synthase (ferredoxin)